MGGEVETGRVRCEGVTGGQGVNARLEAANSAAGGYRRNLVHSQPLGRPFTEGAPPLWVRKWTKLRR